MFIAMPRFYVSRYPADLRHAICRRHIGHCSGIEEVGERCACARTDIAGHALDEMPAHAFLFSRLCRAYWLFLHAPATRLRAAYRRHVINFIYASMMMKT